MANMRVEQIKIFNGASCINNFSWLEVEVNKWHVANFENIEVIGRDFGVVSGEDRVGDVFVSMTIIVYYREK